MSDSRNSSTPLSSPSGGDEGGGGGGGGGGKIFYRAVIVEVLNDPVIYNDEFLAGLSTTKSIKNGDYIVGAPRNSCLVRVISDGMDKAGALYLAYPFFPPHLCMPASPGEQVWLMSEDPKKISDVPFWVARIPENLQVDGVNFTHGDRKLGSSSALSTSEEEESNDEEEENPEPGFPNGDGKPKGYALSKSKKDEGKFDELGIEPEEAKTQILIYTGHDPIEDANAYDILVNGSISNLDFKPEPVPRLCKRPGDLVMQGKNNATIILGDDRGWKDSEDPFKAEGSNVVKSEDDRKRGLQGTIDIVAGRGRIFNIEKFEAGDFSTTKDQKSVDAGGNPQKSDAKGDRDDPRPLSPTSPLSIKNARENLETDKEPSKNNLQYQNPIEGDPDFVRDSSRIYTSMNTSADDNFGLMSERSQDDYGAQFPQTIPAIEYLDSTDGKGNTGFTAEDVVAVQDSPYIVMKSDEIRIIARSDKEHDIRGSIKILKEGYPDPADEDSEVQNKDKNALNGRACIMLQPDGTIVIDGPKIIIGSGAYADNPDAEGDGRQVIMGHAATEPMVLANQLEQLLTRVLDALDALAADVGTHIHPTGTGPSGPPIPPEVTKFSDSAGAAGYDTEALRGDLILMKSKMGKLL
jgi:hypothetical protein